MSGGADGIIGIGIDFGTSNSVAATFDGRQVRIMEFGDGKPSLPSATYLKRDCLAETGQEALDGYVHDNIGRRVELSSIPIGDARTSTGAYDETGTPQPASSNLIFSEAVFDLNLPGRLFYGSKQLLSASESTVLPVFDKLYRVEAVITPILLRIRKELEAELYERGATEQPDHAVIGRPVHFAGGANGGDARAARRLHAAFTYAGFSDQQFCYEPVAAGINYLQGQTRRAPGMLLTVDFGGGTLDFCVFRDDGQRFSVSGTHGIPLGGNHIDQLLYRKLLFPLLGEGAAGTFSTEDGFVTTRFPFDEYADQLLNWPIAYFLNQNCYLTPIHDMIGHGGAEAQRFQRLLDLIQFNYSYLVLEHIKAFKECFATQARATLDLPEIDITLTVEREALDALIAPAIAQFEHALEDALRKAEVSSRDIDRVICVGGSTRLPAVKTALEQRFPGRVVDHDIFTGVAAGLAIQDYQRQLAFSSRTEVMK